MGDVIRLAERRAAREARAGLRAGPSRVEFLFDLCCPFSYLAAERVDRIFDEVERPGIGGPLIVRMTLGGRYWWQGLLPLRGHASREGPRWRENSRSGGAQFDFLDIRRMQAISSPADEIPASFLRRERWRERIGCLPARTFRPQGTDRWAT